VRKDLIDAAALMKDMWKNREVILDGDQTIEVARMIQQERHYQETLKDYLG
jgi:hypothetical protein